MTAVWMASEVSAGLVFGIRMAIVDLPLEVCRAYSMFFPPHVLSTSMIQGRPRLVTDPDRVMPVFGRDVWFDGFPDPAA
jgi:hypothetical protein